MTVTGSKVPILTYDQWRALSVEEAADWWVKRMGMDDEDRQAKLASILRWARAEEDLSLTAARQRG